MRALPLALLLAGCAVLEPPGAGATAEEVRGYCRATASVAQAMFAESPGQHPGGAPRTPDPLAQAEYELAYQSCLDRYRVSP